MRRRAFIATLATAPLWIRRAFGDASVGGVPRAATGAPVAGGVTSTGARTTLVFVVPDKPELRWQRGVAFGEFLNQADERALAALALVDVVCAPAADYGFGGDPLLIVVSDGKARAVAARWPADVPAEVALIRKLVSNVAPLRGSDVTSLAAAARQRYVKKAPRGARWGRTAMCGNEYEEGPADNVDCGMGRISEPSRRFLDFYAKLP